MAKHDLDTVFMEIASSTRRSMLRILGEGDKKLSKIAEILNITIQDAHRNSTRLANCGMITKKSDNLFALTSLGRLVIKNIDSFDFLSTHSEFFETHTVGELPPRFIRRFGDLKDSKVVSGIGPVLENWKRLGTDSEKFIRVITTQYPMDIATTYANKAKKGIVFEYVFDQNIPVPKERNALLKKMSWRKHLSEGNIKRKLIDKVQVCVTVTEKEACLFFPDTNGKTDMLSGLFSVDPEFRQWCLDYFGHVWQEASAFDESKLKRE